MRSKPSRESQQQPFSKHAGQSDQASDRTRRRNLTERQHRHFALIDQGLARLTQIKLLVLIAGALAIAGAMGSMIWQSRDLIAFMKVDGYRRGVLWRWLLCESYPHACRRLLDRRPVRTLRPATDKPRACNRHRPSNRSRSRNGDRAFELPLVSTIVAVIIAMPGYLVVRVPASTVSSRLLTGAGHRSWHCLDPAPISVRQLASLASCATREALWGLRLAARELRIWRAHARLIPDQDHPRRRAERTRPQARQHRRRRALLDHPQLSQSSACSSFWSPTKSCGTSLTPRARPAQPRVRQTADNFILPSLTPSIANDPSPTTTAAPLERRRRLPASLVETCRAFSHRMPSFESVRPLLVREADTGERTGHQPRHRHNQRRQRP